MQIKQSPPPRTLPQASPQRRQAAEKYVASQDKFEETEEIQSKIVSRYDTTGAVVGGGTGLAVFAGGVHFIVNHFTDTELFWPHMTPALLGGVLIGGAIGLGIAKLGERPARQTNFSEARKEMAQAREVYRESLLAEMADEGVKELTNARWEGLKKSEDLESYRPEPATTLMSRELKDLEALADARLEQGWRGELARVQDSPTNYQRELRVVAKHDGIEKALKAAHGD